MRRVMPALKNSPFSNCPIANAILHDVAPIILNFKTMRFPNLRYGKPAEFAHYAMGIPLSDLARILRRDERTIRDWLSAKQRVPWWVPEYMRLRHMEQTEIRRQMNMAALPSRLGIVRGEVIELAVHRPKKESQITDLRLDDFDPIGVAK